MNAAGWIVLAWTLWADPTATAPQGEPLANEPPRERYLLLDDNRISAGRVSVVNGQYVIERSGARIVVPKHKAQLVADSLEEIYRFRAQRIPAQDFPMRADLALWCFEQGLVEFAQNEAQMILAAEPKNEVAHRIMRLCKPPEKRPAEPGKPATVAISRKLRQPDPARVVQQFKSAYGQDLFDEYKQIEPMLRSSCGSAACHGARHEGPFRIYTRTNGTGVDIGLTARNITSMLDAIDYAQPHRSPLLFKSLERHGSSSLPPLGGVQDPTYIQLQEWVHEIARRWSGNEVPLVLPPAEMESEEMEGDTQTRRESFGGGRRAMEPRTVVKRTGRPGRPMMNPGDGESPVLTGLPLADDAPAPPAERMPDPNDADNRSKAEEESTSWPEQSSLNREQEKGERLSAQEMSQPVDEANSTSTQATTPARGPVRRAMNRFMEMVGGKPRFKASIPIQGDKGKVFQAAPPPLSLQEDFLNENPPLDEQVPSNTP